MGFLTSWFRNDARAFGVFIAVAAFSLLAACGGSGGGDGGGSAAPVATGVAPLIVTQPQSLTVADGQPASFIVGATGTAPLTYQWTRGGTAIPGATGASYTIASAQLSDNGASFAVTVTNASGSARSATATLTVTPVAPTLTSVATTVTVAAGAPATFTVVVAGGSLPLTLQWRRNGTAIPGATAATYTTPATTAADDGAVYDLVATNAAGSATSAPFTLRVTPIPQAPAITSQPQALTVRVGDPATFGVTASGTAPLAYQWLRNGQPIAGAQSSTYVLAGAMLSDNNAQFSVTVSNAVGSVTSVSVTLTVLPQPGIALVAGNVGGPGAIDATGPAARFSAPSNVAIDNAGNLYVADASSVRKVASNGAVTTLAGSPVASGTADGPATVARFGLPTGVAVDASGNVYVADNTNSTIRRVAVDGTVVTFAGTAGAAGSADGTGAAASFNAPTGVATDAAGNVYVADTGNHTVRKITPAGVVTTLAGRAGSAGSADGAASAARFNGPRNVAVNAAGAVYVADTANQTIRRIDPSGVVGTLAGSPLVVGSADGNGATASFSSPSGLAVDASGIVYVGDLGNRTVRRITPAGAVTTIAGTAGQGGSADGTAAAARFAAPTGLAADASGVVYVADRDNYAVRRIAAGGAVATYAGAPLAQGSTDASGSDARFAVPFGVAVDAAGTLYVADYFNATVRKVTPGGAVTTLAGLAGATGTADGAGAAARFTTPQGIAVDGAGNVYVADKNGQTIRKISAGGIVSTLAGSPGVRGAADGAGAAASFNDPASVAVDAAGNVYVADNNPTIRRISPAGVVTTIAGAAGRFGAVDGPGNVASFRFPQGIAFDTSGNLIVAEAGNALVRKVTPSGVVSTLAGVPGQTGSLDGPTATARFTLPTGVAVDAANVVYVSDIGTHTIRRIDPAGTVTTVVGVADGARGVKLGALPGHLDLPVALAIDASGNLDCTDSNGVLRITFR